VDLTCVVVRIGVASCEDKSFKLERHNDHLGLSGKSLMVLLATSIRASKLFATIVVSAKVHNNWICLYGR
jgi:hypothetical protein